MSIDADPTPAHRAQRLIDVGVNMTVATVGSDGTPWASPVFYVPDEDYNLYWTSETTARHSENIRATWSAAIVIIEPDPERRVDAVYLQAEVHELTDPDEIRAGIAVMLAKPQPERWMISNVSDVSGNGPWRIYRAVPSSIEVRSTNEVGGKAVARRTDAEFRSHHLKETDREVH